jgi:hypothetical protein
MTHRNAVVAEIGVQVGKIIATLVIAAAALLGSGGTVNAAYCDASSTGCDSSGALLPGGCAGHGAFGAFGQKGDYGHDFRGGANGDTTAYNNSTLCGNPQGAAGQLGD